MLPPRYSKYNQRLFQITAFQICFLFFVLVKASLGQPSLIETVQNLLPSLVDIKTENLGMAQAPHAAAIDKATGRLVILRNVKSAYYRRDGAGVIVDSSGLIVTNAHIVENGGKILVTLSDNKKLSAVIVAVFPKEDLAFIRIVPPYPLTPITYVDSDTIQLGDEVVTVGSSPVLNQTISGGKIIGLGSDGAQQNRSNTTDLFQVNINVYKGDSGGPLFDTKGHLVGLMTAGQIKADRSSFAIPSNQIRKHHTELLPPRQR